MENSNNITIMINPYISDKDFMTFDGKFHGKSSEQRFIHITKEFVNGEYTGPSTVAPQKHMLKMVLSVLNGQIILLIGAVLMILIN